MDADLVALASSAATSLTTLLVNDGWEHVKDGFAQLWRRTHPTERDVVSAELDLAREELLVGRSSGDALVKDAVEARLRVQLERLMSEDPAVVGYLRDLIADAQSGPSTRADAVTMNISANGAGQVNALGSGNQHNTYR